MRRSFVIAVAAAGAGAALWLRQFSPDERQVHMMEAETWLHGVASEAQEQWAAAQPFFDRVAAEAKLQWTAASVKSAPLYQQGFQAFKELTDMPALDERVFMGVCAMALLLSLTLLRFILGCVCGRRRQVLPVPEPHWPYMETPTPVVNAFATPAPSLRQPIAMRSGSARRAATPPPRKVPAVSPIAEELGFATRGGIPGQEEQSIIALLNCGTLEELQTLQGIGPRNAATIMGFRAGGRKFRNLDDLVTELGLSPVRRYFQELLGGA